MDLAKFYTQFREETTENLRIFSDGLLVLEKAATIEDPGAREQLDAIFRAMHTIKGSSRLLGFGAIGRLAHTMENILGAVREGSHTLDRELIDDMLKSGDALLEMTTAAVEGGTTSVNVDQLVDKLNGSLERKSPAPAQPEAASLPAADQPAEAPESREDRKAKRRARLAAQRAKWQQEEGEKQEGQEEQGQQQEGDQQESVEAAPTTAPLAAPPDPPASAPPAVSSTPATSATTRLARPVRQQTVRVRVDRLDRLINLTGELVVSKQVLTNHARVLQDILSLVQQQEQELLALETFLGTLRLTPDQRHAAEQQINSLLNTGDQSRQVLREQVEQFNQHVLHQSMLVNDLEQEVMAVRMLPVSNVFSSLPRAVRELTNTTSKEVELELQGETTELDRKLLEALNDPLMHLIRNAIDHGIELPDERESQGKPRKGRLEVRAEPTGGEVHLIIRDDGRGMHPPAIREIAINKGLITRENAQRLSDQESLELIFLPGFSSAKMITDISGRGVGMDVVRTNISELGGQVTIESQPGTGTCITLILPLTIVTTRILLIQVGPYTFALPASGCQGIIWANQESLHTIEGRPMIMHEGQTVPLLRMADLMNIESVTPFQNGTREPAILIGTTQQRLISLIVDQLIDEREAVVKPLGPVFEQQRRYNGAVQLGDGQLILLLNPIFLAQAARGITPTVSKVVSTTTRQIRSHLLIAEDSFTTRELIRSILQSAGYEVTAAVDGHDALDKLRAQAYDLVVTDVEMPRVDGFQLTTRIRQELGMQDMPVVIITSLASDDYRRRGLEAGAQAYIVKSQFNQDNLLTVIQQLLGQ